jgi:serine/threonine-protein kinase RsbW
MLAELKARDFNDNDIFAVHLALDEAFENAVVHGNKMNPAKKVKVEYTVDSDKIEISITDEGNGFEPESVPDPRFGPGLEETAGRGLLLMNSYMDTVKFNESGNSVYMTRYKERPDVTKGHSETKCL